MALASNMISPAVMDLGMGDSLKRQMADNEEERKKKLLRQAQEMQKQSGMSPATQMLFGMGNG